MKNASAVRMTVAAVMTLSGVGCIPEADPVYERCVTEQRTYCDRLFVCLELGTLIGVTVNYEDESSCYAEEERKCEEVSSANACPGGANETYNEARHEQCIQDQENQGCAAFAERPTSCSTYCSTTEQ